VLQSVAACCSMLRCIALCCNVLQRVVLRCNVLQCVAAHCTSLSLSYRGMLKTQASPQLQCEVVCCSVMQKQASPKRRVEEAGFTKVAVRCSVLQVVALCCSALHAIFFFLTGAC